MSGVVGATAAFPSVAWPQQISNFRIIPCIEPYPAGLGLSFATFHVYIFYSRNILDFSRTFLI